MYRVVRTDNGSRNPHTGIVSNHRTLEAAQEWIDKANRRLCRSRGQEQSWHPYAIERSVVVASRTGRPAESGSAAISSTASATFRLVDSLRLAGDQLKWKIYVIPSGMVLFSKLA